MNALANRGVSVVREGAGHTIVKSAAGRQSSVPRHNSIQRSTARKIAKQLEFDWPSFEADIS
jgi:hypothetical protein